MTAYRVSVAAITLDFGNTLVRVDRHGLRAVVEVTADAAERQGLVADRSGFLTAWAEERERQFREEVPEFRDVDVDQRAVRVLARAHGMAAPRAGERWDDVAAANVVEPADVTTVVDVYSQAFIDRMTPVPDARSTLEALARRGFALAILSNWPLAVTIDRFADTHGWTPLLRAIVVSQRVGTIKPHPTIFRTAEEALGLAGRDAGARILHVGDDWAADVVGAHDAGWRTAYLRDRQADSPLPSSVPGAGAGRSIEPDLVIGELAELLDRVELAEPPIVAGAPTRPA